MIESTRVSFPFCFIHKLHAGAGTLLRAIFITRYTHLALKDSSRAHTPQAVTVAMWDVAAGWFFLGREARASPWLQRAWRSSPAQPNGAAPTWGAQPGLGRGHSVSLCRDSTVVAVVDREVSRCQIDKAGLVLNAQSVPFLRVQCPPGMVCAVLFSLPDSPVLVSVEKLPLCYPQTAGICQQEICVSSPCGLMQL